MSTKFLFDIETIPRKESVDRLLKKYEVVDDEPASVPITCMNGTIDSIKESISKGRVTKNWLNAAIKIENDNKGRVGVLSCLRSELKKYEDPIPDKLLSLPESQRIITFCYDLDGVTQCSIAHNDDQERKILETFWELARTKTPAGWYIYGFDLPVILLESIRLGVKESTSFNFAGIGHGFLDIMLARFGRSQHQKLSDVAVSLGFEDDDKDPLAGGHEVLDAYNEKRYNEILEHNVIDVDRLRYVDKCYGHAFY